MSFLDKYKKSTKSLKPDKERKLFRDRNHKKFPNEKLQGLNGTELSEEGIIPEFLARAGDCIISPKTLKMGQDNNQMIIMGRDRNGLGESAFKDNLVTENGFGSCMAAGSIDIVVGRMSPYPIGSIAGKPIFVGPAFTTKDYNKKAKEKGPSSALTTEQVENYKDQDGSNVFVKAFSHPGLVMDAARIYISQMTNLDDYFGIKKDIFVTPGVKATVKKSTPHSGIMIKADEVRLHSRKDIKIVTGGIGETHDSLGNPLPIQETGRIHLLVGNGLRTQHPVPLGNNLAALFNKFFKVFEDYVNNVNSFVSQQIKFNSAVAGHVHTELGAAGMATLPDILNLKLGAETTYFQLVNNVIGGGLAITAQMRELRTYTNPGKGNDKYINSRVVTTS